MYEKDPRLSIPRDVVDTVSWMKRWDYHAVTAVNFDNSSLRLPTDSARSKSCQPMFCSNFATAADDYSWLFDFDYSLDQVVTLKIRWIMPLGIPLYGFEAEHVEDTHVDYVANLCGGEPNQIIYRFEDRRSQHEITKIVVILMIF